MSKIKLSKEELAAYKIGSQADLDRLQQVMSEQMGKPVELAPFEGVSNDVRDYLASKGITPDATAKAPEIPPAESVINVNDILEYNKLKNK